MLQTRVCTAGRIQVPVQSNRESWGERWQREWGASPWRWSGWCRSRAESTWWTCECSGARPRRWSPRPCWNDWRCAPWGSRQRSAWGTAGCWPERMRAAHAMRCGPPACAAGWPQRWRGLWKQEVTVTHVPRFTHGSENGHPPTAECWKWLTECDQACEKRKQCAWSRKDSHKCNYSHEWNTEQKNSQLRVARGSEAQLFMQLVSETVTNGMCMEWKSCLSAFVWLSDKALRGRTDQQVVHRMENSHLRVTHKLKTKPVSHARGQKSCMLTGTQTKASPLSVTRKSQTQTVDDIAEQRQSHVNWYTNQNQSPVWVT